MDPTEMVAAYGASWNELDRAARTALLESTWSDDGIHEDPSGRVKGRAALVEHIGAVQSQLHGHSLVITTGVDRYGSLLRFGWAMRHGDDVALEGVDFGELADDGRLERITGFFGPYPPLTG